MLSLVPAAKATLTYRAIFRSLFASDWESTWQEHFGAHAVRAYSSADAGFAAILKTLHAVRPERNEVILSAYCRPTLISTIRDAGLEPRIIDLDIMSATMSMNELRKSVNPKTLAIMTTNLFGAVDPIEEIWTICRQTGVFLIEDISQALGSYSSKIELGMFGDVAFFGLDTDSVVTTINGAITCWRNPALAKVAPPGATLERISWRALGRQLLYPLRMNRFVAATLLKFRRGRTAEPGPASPGDDTKWSSQQARLSALLLTDMEKEAGYRRKLCGMIKRHEAQLGRDLLRHEKFPKMTQYPCLAESGEDRERILSRLEQHGFTATRGHDTINSVIDTKTAPKSGVLETRLFTLPCHPGLPLSLLETMLAQIDQGSEAVTASVKKRYTSLVERYGEKPAANGYRGSGFRVRRRLLARQLEKLPKESLMVLDSGCGNGVTGPVFREHIKTGCLDGVDLNGDALQIAHEQYGYTRTFVSNAMSLYTAVAGKKYDFVNSSGVIAYVAPDQFENFLRAHRNCLVEGGHFLLTFSNPRSLWRKASQRTIDLPFEFSADDVVAALDGAGLRILSAMGCDTFSATHFELSNNITSGMKNRLSREISILCEAI
jgi:dTDP-4-amino-4,6-dideoxygalactose transaminase/SAM-dependent methyltransferase